MSYTLRFTFLQTAFDKIACARAQTLQTVVCMFVIVQSVSDIMQKAFAIATSDARTARTREAEFGNQCSEKSGTFAQGTNYIRVIPPRIHLSGRLGPVPGRTEHRTICNLHGDNKHFLLAAWRPGGRSIIILFVRCSDSYAVNGCTTRSGRRGLMRHLRLHLASLTSGL